ncbi:hypothetical protein IWX75_001895 [Arthrobacter sp. CAN_A6]
MKTSQPPHGRSSFRRAGYRLAEGLALVTVFLLVAGLGLGVTAGKDPVGKDYTDTEQAQLEAVRRASALAAQARDLAAVVPETVLSARILQTADMLEQQAGALALPAPAASAAAATSTPADGTGDGSADSTTDGTGRIPAEGDGDPARSRTPDATVGALEPPSVETFTASLANCAQAGLQDAARMQPGPARLLATAAAGQWQYAAELSARTGVASGLPTLDQPAGAAWPAADADPQRDDCANGRPDDAETAGADVDPAEPATPDTTATPATTATNSPATSATPTVAATTLVSAALRAELGAEYAYEVAAARLPDPAVALQLSGRHAEAAASAAVLLARLCGTVPPVPAAFHLDPVLLADPARGTAVLEQELSGMYGDLVGLSGGVTRAWAIAQLNAAVQRSHAADGLAEAFPGLTIDPTADETALPQDSSAALPRHQPTALPEDTP